MAAKGFLFLLTITTALLMSSFQARELPFPQAPDHNPTPELQGSALDCLTALYKIRSCSNEIIAYFSNGTIDITPPCCQAITLITHSCWPAVLSILGYSPDQASILRGYCDAVASEVAQFGPVPSPLGQPL
ncbi:egg cell-secreted protein 1.4-like [Sesamum indicum]|uniref:Egg cell-secreted protein 1.4-like n=1 Tax=Sesamum indicum TaxID=4182 RepID=A0A6I9TWH9_SESIN|nr:egg cell-secreted protein 1.4-like [Sesamum indicum]